MQCNHKARLHTLRLPIPVRFAVQSELCHGLSVLPELRGKGRIAPTVGICSGQVTMRKEAVRLGNFVAGHLSLDDRELAFTSLCLYHVSPTHIHIQQRPR